MVTPLSEHTEQTLVKQTYFRFLLQKLIYPNLKKPIQKLDGFLKENTHLFTLIGVFGAISIYLRTVDKELEQTAKLAGEFAFVTGFVIIILLSLVILSKLYLRMRESGNGVSSFENLGLVLFAVPFTLLILVIGGIISEFPTALAFYGFIIVYVGSIFSVFISMLSVTKMFELLKERVPVNDGIIGLLVFSLFTFSLILSTGASGALSPEAIENVGNGGTLSQWFNVYLTLSLTFLTLISLGISLLFLTVLIIGGIIAIILYLREKSTLGQ